MSTKLREIRRCLVQRVLAGDIPQDQIAFHALSSLLEGALADPEYCIDDTQELVPLLKALAHGKVDVRDLL